ncbi:diphosphomevalonate decarboxylase [Spizellomyces punctatus DAOM BR117]|uniref:Diphosphomevalonate decarboxylase n=1 Tax=Spizellomyces punctatus (strain DAOM BR117) TaxID=645134 RepID=A0A0L0H537_SPIPD|nr:diphosphomevalonate decarboxylase [Spizellomyces punctatus DAOM BR117]KNC96337.1 diphosphomevalonate decarboxylase [Spizellomyces punctatus DAOM BR117]|eukprot:XP_016604377.1 diphosphomevalonate decarboxylase [Spizellomyces punctatus DAOM BR117]
MLSTNPHAFEVTVSAPVNIAVVKYWGKRDTSLLLPTNSSLSLTLSQDDLRSTTTVRADPSFERDRLWLNGKEEDVTKNKRMVNVVRELRALRQRMEQDDASLEKLSAQKLHVCSQNNFPTAAGLASSASGFAALTFGIAHAIGVADKVSRSDLSRLARLGSGSACRSLFGGFVAWEMGSRPDGVDSVAVQVADESHWPDMEALVLVASDARKDTPSTAGMQLTVETSELLQERIRQVPQRMQDMKQAIANKDYDAFAELTMMDSNQFHAVCLDTFPPITYLNDVSRAVIHLITAYNALFTGDGRSGRGKKGYRAAYTFDAGPNAVLYILKEHVPEVLALVNRFFPPPEGEGERKEYFGRAANFMGSENVKAVDDMVSRIGMKPLERGSLRRIISTSVGDGPRILARGWNAHVSLLGEDGLPKTEIA